MANLIFVNSCTSYEVAADLKLQRSLCVLTLRLLSTVSLLLELMVNCGGVLVEFAFLLLLLASLAFRKKLRELLSWVAFRSAAGA